MPRKIRQLRADLQREGFALDPKQQPPLRIVS